METLVHIQAVLVVDVIFVEKVGSAPEYKYINIVNQLRAVSYINMTVLSSAIVLICCIMIIVDILNGFSLCTKYIDYKTAKGMFSS